MKTYSRTKNSVLSVLTGFSGQSLSILVNFVCRTVFIKTLGVEYLGINGLFSDILSMLSLAELGFDTAISFRLYKPIAEKNEEKAREYLAFFRTVYIIIGCVIFLFGTALIPFLHYFIADYDTLRVLKINAPLVFLLFLIQNTSSYFFFAYRSIVLRVDQKQYVLDVVGAAITIVSGIIKILVLVIFKDFIAYIVTALSFVIIQNLVCAYIAKINYPTLFVKSRNKITREERKELFKDCGALFVYKINGVVMKATDNVVLSSFIGLVIVGRYSNYVLIFSAFRKILHSVYQAVKASMGNLFVTSDIEKKYFFFEVMNFVSIILYGMAGLWLTVSCNDFIRIWVGSEFEIPQPLPLLLGIELILTGLKENLAQIRHVSGVFKQMWFRPVIGSIINLTASVILVRYIGVLGVVVGTILAAIFANLLVDPVVIHKNSFSNYRHASFYYKKNLCYLVVLGVIFSLTIFLCNSIKVDNTVLKVFIDTLFSFCSVPIIFSTLYWKSDICVYLRKKLLTILRGRIIK